MSSFCAQCSIDIFREDLKDYEHMAPELEPFPEGKGIGVLCEDCGWTVVDELGKCISKTCLKKHGEKD